MLLCLNSWDKQNNHLSDVYIYICFLFCFVFGRSDAAKTSCAPNPLSDAMRKDFPKINASFMDHFEIYKKIVQFSFRVLISIGRRSEKA